MRAQSIDDFMVGQQVRYIAELPDQEPVYKVVFISHEFDTITLKRVGSEHEHVISIAKAIRMLEII